MDNGSMYAIEASRRGAVVITYDAAGNGLSERNDAVGTSFNAEMMLLLNVFYRGWLEKGESHSIASSSDNSNQKARRGLQNT